MKLKNNNIIVEIDEKTGATVAIKYPYDDTEMNWILKCPAWGLIDGFETSEVKKDDNAISVITENQRIGLRVAIEKAIDEDNYYEKYLIQNIGKAEYFLTKDNFGIPFPTNCIYGKGCNLMDKVVSHLWCGGDVCWMYQKRTNGDPNYHIMNVTEGAIDDYSISYDYSKVAIGADWRGVFLLHPRECTIKQKDSITLCFRHRFSNIAPENASLDFDGALRFIADKYSVSVNEKVNLKLEYNGNISDAVIKCGDKTLPLDIKGNKAECSIEFSNVGEYEITAAVDGKTTFIKLKVLMSVSEILEKRAHFIAEKQQFHSEGSHLDGAYLIYDREKDGLYYGRIDHNAGRERIGMGVTVCRALQVKYSETLMKSLRKHREFVERELVDIESGTIYNDIDKNNTFFRLYNFPWFSLYYLEWYNLTGEIQCLINSAQILIKYYEAGGKEQDSQNIEAVRILESLKKEGLQELYDKLFECFISHADSILERNGICESKEVTWVNELPNDMCCYLSQAYILTGKEKYLEEAEKCLKKSSAFYAYQPDFHLNCVTVRYWDNYWFGKIRSYGDVFPHYWSALSGWSLYWYDKAKGCHEHKREIENNLTGNLCIYDEDGFAANCYLYPYRIELYSSDPLKKNQFMKSGITYGKRYDPWANDQDWALYLASEILDT